VSVPTNAPPVTGLDLLLDAAGYGAVAGLAQTVSHKIFARKQLPSTWEELITRYVAGSTINALTCSVWALHRPNATGREAAAMQWLILGASGLVVASLHYFDAQLAEAAREEGKKLGADALRRVWKEQEDGRATAHPERVRGPLGT
jgi:hypothetical protein